MSDEFVRKVFSKYYQQAQFDITRIDQREFGVGNTKKIDARHLSFPTTDEFRNFLVTNTPLFVSHSASYYRYPAATPIEKKTRIGADMIFDLDLHSSGKYSVYSRLDEVKQDVIRLAEDFLYADFGLAKDDILIAFSGNRGYHVHVRNSDFAVLEAEERREIMNYIRGDGLDVRRFFTWEEIKKHKRLLGPKPDDGGYKGRLAQHIINVLKEDPARISPRRFSNSEKREFFISGIKEGNWSRTTMKLDEIPKKIDELKEGITVRSVNADPAVTYDMSKLIRVPNSIHGDTGFVAKTVADIDTFDPLRHSVINGPEIKIKFSEKVPEIQLLGRTFGPFSPDEKTEVPLGAALFFILKKSAALS